MDQISHQITKSNLIESFCFLYNGFIFTNMCSMFLLSSPFVVFLLDPLIYVTSNVV